MLLKECNEEYQGNLKYGIGAGINKEIRITKSTSYKTNVEAIDGLIGGGIPAGSMIEIHGEEATGKTLISLEYIKDAQRKGYKTAIFDYDMNLNLNFARKVGVNLNELEIINIPIAEDSLELLYKMVDSNQYGVIVIDSLPAILPKEEETASYDEIDIRTQSKIINEFLFKVKPLLAKSKTILVFTNQTRMSIYSSGYRTVGGRTFRSFMDLRLLLERDSYLTVDKDIMGVKIEVLSMKNKLYGKIMMSHIDIVFDYGIVNYS